MANQTPFFSGKDAVLRFFIDGDEVILNAKTWKVTAQGQKAADGVNGEDRARLQFLIDFFELTAECFMNDGKQIDAIQKYIANNDGQLTPFDGAAAIMIRPLDGTKKNFQAKELCWDGFDINNGGRTDRVMFSLQARFRYFEPIPG